MGASEWAMSATQTLQTNLCVMGRKTPTLSAEQVGSCYPTRGTILCTAWVIPTAWLYIDQFGVRSEECLPYYGENLPRDECSTCTNSSASDEVYKCPVKSSKWSMDRGDDGLKQAIMMAGAVQTTIGFVPELWNYTGGIHNPQPQAPDPRSELAVKFVGWGTEDESFYWIAENTWGPNWGENGYFRVTNNAGSKWIAVNPGIACVQNQTVQFECCDCFCELGLERGSFSLP